MDVNRRLTINLWDHQEQMVRFLQTHKPGGLLQAGMGTGKTLGSLGFVLSQDPPRNILVLCPANARRVWDQQMDDFFTEETKQQIVRSIPRSGTVEGRAENLYYEWETAQRLKKTFVGVTNYTTMDYEPMRAALKAVEWDWVFFDESHHVKAVRGKRAREAYRVSREASVSLLTGTPQPNSPQDIWAQMRLVSPSILGSLRSFHDRYAVKDRYGTIVEWTNLEDLRQRLEPHTLHIPEGVADLPDRTFSTRYVTLSDDLLEEHERRLNELRSTQSEDDIFRHLNALQKIASGWGESHFEDDKVRQTAEVIRDIGETPIVVFFRFHDDKNQLAPVLSNEYHLGELSGRADDLDQFESGEIDVLLVQIQAGSEAIDLTRARYGIFYSPTWSYGQYKQAYKRLHRPGQDQTTHFITMVSEDTIEEDMVQAVKRKKNLAQQLQQTPYPESMEVL